MPFETEINISSCCLGLSQPSSFSPDPHIHQTFRPWAYEWRMVLNPTKCQLLYIDRMPLPAPFFQISGLQLECASHLRYLGMRLDIFLSWREHFQRASQSALTQLLLILVGTIWYFHPRNLFPVCGSQSSFPFCSVLPLSSAPPCATSVI